MTKTLIERGWVKKTIYQTSNCQAAIGPKSMTKKCGCKISEWLPPGTKTQVALCEEHATEVRDGKLIRVYDRPGVIFMFGFNSNRVGDK